MRKAVGVIAVLGLIAAVALGVSNIEFDEAFKKTLTMLQGFPLLQK